MAVSLLILNQFLKNFSLTDSAIKLSQFGYREFHHTLNM